MKTMHKLEGVQLDDAMDQKLFRNTLGNYASGVTVISGTHNGEPVGFTCQSFYSVSVEPPLISFSVMLTSTTYPRIRESGKFAVNVLAEAQREISNQFARKGSDKWAGIEWRPTRQNNPVIEDSLMWLDCDIVSEHVAGDHYIVVGRVNEMSQEEWHAKTPLLFFKGQYRELGD